MAGKGRTLQPVSGIHDLVALRLPALDIGSGIGRWVALQSTDRLLRRFGQADVLKLSPGAQLSMKERATADEVWALIEGEATFEWEDLRPSSPTSGASARLASREPTAVLVPFGVAFRVTAGTSRALLLRLTTHGDDEDPVADLFRVDPAA